MGNILLHENYQNGGGLDTQVKNKVKLAKIQHDIQKLEDTNKKIEEKIFHKKQLLSSTVNNMYPLTTPPNGDTSLNQSNPTNSLMGSTMNSVQPLSLPSNQALINPSGSLSGSSNSSGQPNMCSSMISGGLCPATLLSHDGKYKMIMQTDGNLVLYNSAQMPVWASSTYGKGTGPYKLMMNSTGTLSIFDTNGINLWSSGVPQNGVGPYRAIMHNDGNFNVVDAHDTIQWATLTQGK
jgi:hypothetical protein